MAKNPRARRAKTIRNQAVHRALRQQLIVAGKVLVDQGQDDFTRGHISLRLPDNPNVFFMKAHSIGLDEITPENILTIDLEGNVVAGTARRHSEVYIHSEIFKARPDVNCVIHTHPTYSIALSATGRGLKCYSQPGALFHQALGTYDDTIALIRSHAMGAGVARALGRGAYAPWDFQPYLDASLLYVRSDAARGERPGRSRPAGGLPPADGG